MPATVSEAGRAYREAEDDTESLTTREETMRKLGDVSVAKLLWFAGVSFALMALWTWYNFARS